MPTIVDLKAREILDSRGRPTISVYCKLASGVEASASVPSGASTGAAEALELRDNDPHRYGGLGCRKAVSHVNGELKQILLNRPFQDQSELDLTMCKADSTPNKARLGANAILGISIAFARTTSLERKVPLYRYFSDILGSGIRSLPCLTINLFSGGKHAGGQISIQDVLVVPVSPTTIDDALAMTFAVYQSAAEFARRKYAMRLLRADEGGLAPPFENVDAMLEGAVESIRGAGLIPGKDMALAVDVASSHFYKEGYYHLETSSLNGQEMIQRLGSWVKQFPIISIEDGLAEDDWQHWPSLCSAFLNRVMILGDDFLCTNPARIQRAIQSKAANALLLKVNQIGTLTEAAEACRLARSDGWQVIVSARSGETEDNWLADLAVGWSGNQIKIGSITQSERLAKYNRLLAIESETRLPMLKPPFL